MSIEVFLKFGGLFHLLCAGFHLFKPRMLQWHKKLENIPDENKSVLSNDLNLMNLCILLFWLILAVIPFFYAGEMLNTGIGKALLTAIVLFWVIRIFILQPVLAGFKSKSSILQSLFFLIGFLLFLIPFITIFKYR